VVNCSFHCRAFTGHYWDVKDDGTYTCIVCGEELFKLVIDCVLCIYDQIFGKHFKLCIRQKLNT